MSKKKTFGWLLKTKGMSEKELSEQLNVSMETIREWEDGTSLPSVENIRQMSAIFQETLEILFELFKPEMLHVKKDANTSKELCDLMKAIFYNMQEPEDFIDLFFAFSVRNSRGIIIVEDGRAFSFIRVLSKINGDAVIFADESDNIVVLTKRNMVSVRPVCISCNVYVTDINVNVPVFPEREKSVPKTFRQIIRIFCKKEEHRYERW